MGVWGWGGGGWGGCGGGREKKERKKKKQLQSWSTAEGGGLKGVEIFLWLFGMRSKSKNTFPMWRTECNMGQLTCQHTHTHTHSHRNGQSGVSWSVHSAHLKQPSGELDDPGRD